MRNIDIDIEIQDQKFVIFFDGQKIYLDAKEHTTDKHSGVYRFYNEKEKVIALFPIELTAIILNNPSK